MRLCQGAHQLALRAGKAAHSEEYDEAQIVKSGGGVVSDSVGGGFG